MNAEEIDFGIERSRRIDPIQMLKEKDLSKKTLQIQRLAQQSRIDVFDIIHRRGNGHWGGSSSSAELLAALYFHIMKVKPEIPTWEDRDRLVVSKGHAAPMLYTMLAKRGYFPLEELKTLRHLNSRLQGHPCMNKTPGVEMSTGALGHGISVGLGMALSARVLNKNYWTFVIVGDGCLNEGQSWEGIMAAAKFKPPRLVVLVDYNRVQLDGSSDEIMPLDPLYDKFRAFHLNVAERVYDGHSVKEILESWEWMQQQEQWPLVVIYRTVKGKGISFTENNHKWHGAPIDPESYESGRPELLKQLANLEEQ